MIVGVRPGVKFLEVRLHYTLSIDRLALPDGDQSRVGFANLDLLFAYDMRHGPMRIMVGLGWMGGIVHTNQGVGGTFGPVQVTRVMYQLTETVGLGIFVDLRFQLYHLPGSDVPILSFGNDAQLVFGHCDAQVQSGLALTFW